MSAFLKKILTIIFCVLAFVIQIVLLFSLGTYKILENDTFNKEMKDVPVWLTLMDEDNVIANELVDIFKDIDVSEINRNIILNSPGFINIYKDITSSYVNYYLFDGENLLNKSDINNLIDKNAVDIMISDEISLNDEEKTVLINYLKEELNNRYNQYSMKLDKLLANKIYTDIIRFPFLQIILIVLLTICYIIVSLLNDGFIKTLKMLGIIIIMASSLQVILNGVIYFSYQPILDLQFSKGIYFYSFFQAFIKYFSLYLIMYSIISLLIGYIILIVYKTLSKKNDYKKKLNNIIIEEE